MPPVKRLTVNADDYGLTAGVSAGIRAAHLQGIVTSTTAMMNMPSAAADLHLLRAECPALGVGVHLVLTAGRPLRPPDKVHSLVTFDGAFPALTDMPLAFARLDPVQLQDEWRAQIEAGLAAGMAVDHLDSHHHAAYLDEIAFEAMLILAQEYHLPIRGPWRPPEAPAAGEGAPPDNALTVSRFGPRLRAQYAVRTPARLIDTFYGERATLDVLLELLRTLPAGSFELMCHPGRTDDELRDRSNYNAARERELAALTSPLVRAAIAQRNITLVNYSAI
jgi:chitin disaccharide deacetylase